MAKRKVPVAPTRKNRQVTGSSFVYPATRVADAGKGTGTSKQWPKAMNGGATRVGGI